MIGTKKRRLKTNVEFINRWIMEYKLIYSDRKSISASVKGGVLTVRAPRGVKQKTIEDFLARHRVWIEEHLWAAKKKEERFSSLTDKEISEIKKNARVYLVCKTEYFSKIMGLKYGRITITSAKTRFGSCSSKGNISYSWRLMLYPEAAREYVVVHELAHLVEMNHSDRFYKIIERILPDYKDRKRMLK